MKVLSKFHGLHNLVFERFQTSGGIDLSQSHFGVSFLVSQSKAKKLSYSRSKTPVSPSIPSLHYPYFHFIQTKKISGHKWSLNKNAGFSSKCSRNTAGCSFARARVFFTCSASWKVLVAQKNTFFQRLSSQRKPLCSNAYKCSQRPFDIFKVT